MANRHYYSDGNSLAIISLFCELNYCFPEEISTFDQRVQMTRYRPARPRFGVPSEMRGSIQRQKRTSLSSPDHPFSQAVSVDVPVPNRHHGGGGEVERPSEALPLALRVAPQSLYFKITISN